MKLPEKPKMLVTATVQVTVIVPLSQPWNDDEKVSTIVKGAREEAEGIIARVLSEAKQGLKMRPITEKDVRMHLQLRDE